MAKILSFWNLSHAVILSLSGMVYILTDQAILLYIAAGLSFGILILLTKTVWINLYPVGGYANHLTLVRLLLLFSIPFLSSPILIFGLLLLSIVLDAFDGYLARKFNTISDFGSFLDIETDSFFMVVLCLALNRLDFAEKWIIHAGLLRYYYIMIKWIFQLHEKKEPRINAIRYTAIAVFVLFFSPFILPETFHQVALISGSAILLTSFTYSFIRLVKK